MEDLESLMKEKSALAVLRNLLYKTKGVAEA